MLVSMLCSSYVCGRSVLGGGGGGCDKVTRLRNNHMITPIYYACIVYGRTYVNCLAGDDPTA